MALYFRVKDGPLKGQTTLIKPGLTLGRKGELQLEDAKVSGLHAKVVAAPSGELFLLDNKSKNGLKINGEKVAKVSLLPGVTIQVGNFFLEVMAKEPSRRPPKEASPPPPQPPKAEAVVEALDEQGPIVTEAPPPPPIPVRLTWNELLENFSEKMREQIKGRPKVVVPFVPAVRLEFLRGLQAESSWVLGYGPRKAGSHSIDLPIYEPGAPDICFEILPTPRGLTFRTSHPEIVLLNGKSTPSQVLKAGDLIQINQTEIAVDFIR